ncbi:hypothetical protein BJF83_19015 [Nocardiopsis sp. CNR-923]|uniref:alpha/beta hydrolase n=1 Tax=Nocardiopsis sp. CNR-923 TaxID=1904965 RepID=UPI0009638F40|nr:alpha/beta hydrolase [Nocardiopsis sp. CNR-923]OLT27179.1 hypothetical protein BJF83_19015 [Nocardiopsis sp. CNR-923]
MRRINRAIFASATALGLVAAPAAGSALAEPDTSARGGGDVIQLPVTFEVDNVNRSAVQCNTDGGTYEVAGHLTAPADAFRGRPRDLTVTMYQHGIAGGEWYWNMDLEGYNHVEEMAERGHVSVSVDRIGYDASGVPNGYDTCIGAQADITNQIVEQLREGDYELDRSADRGAIPGRRTPEFDKVVLAGQSNGGLIVNIAAISFGNVDGLSVHGWGDLGFTPEADERFIAATGGCLQRMSPAVEDPRPELPEGYNYYDNGTEEFLTGNFADATPEMLEAVTPLQNAHPCNDMSTITSAIYVDLMRMDEIDVPVHVVFGEEDARIRDVQLQADLYSGSPDVRTLMVPDAGHYMGLERNAETVFEDMDAWLTESVG